MLICHVSGTMKFFFSGYSWMSFHMCCVFIVKKIKIKINSCTSKMKIIYSFLPGTQCNTPCNTKTKACIVCTLVTSFFLKYTNIIFLCQSLFRQRIPFCFSRKYKKHTLFHKYKKYLSHFTLVLMWHFFWFFHKIFDPIFFQCVIDVWSDISKMRQTRTLSHWSKRCHRCQVTQEFDNRRRRELNSWSSDINIHYCMGLVAKMFILQFLCISSCPWSHCTSQISHSRGVNLWSFTRQDVSISAW